MFTKTKKKVVRVLNILGKLKNKNSLNQAFQEAYIYGSAIEDQIKAGKQFCTQVLRLIRFCIYQTRKFADFTKRSAGKC